MANISDELTIGDEIRDWCDRNDENGCGGFVTEYRIDAELVELPKSADGAPIHVGDTVYLDDGRKAEVRRIQLSERENSICFDVCGDFFSLWPENLTHTAPDSLERIADELEAWCDRVDVDGDACDKPRALAERIRKLAAKEQTNE